MSSKGPDAWNKYFRGKGDIDTRLKTPSVAYDASTNSKLNVTYPAGTEIIYLKATKHEPKALVKVKDARGKFQLVRVNFNDIAKPGVKSSGAVSLKPQAFKLASDSEKYSIAEYSKILQDALDERKDLSPELKTYLTALYENTIGKLADNKLTSIYNKVKNDLPLNDINKDFGEVIGPLAVYYKKTLKPKGITFSARMKIGIPLRPNEPLMDYGLYDNGESYIISAKSGDSTNTVKPQDIINLISKNPKMLKKWKEKTEYKVLEVLSSASTLTGPIRAVSFLFPKLIDEKAVISDKPAKIDQSKMTKFINENQYLSKKKNLTINEIMYECEKTLMLNTKNGTLDMNSIFADAIQNTVIYIKFELGATGIGHWDSVISSDIIKSKKDKKVFLRTKNGYTRASDRMGIQI